MDISNLNALKVADLKQLLKARGLSIVGIKSELIQRLESAMLSDPIVVNTGAVGNTAKAIEKEIDEDAILADDDESFSKPDESLLHNEDLLLSESSIVTANAVAKAIPASQPVANSTATAVIINSSQSEVSNIAPKATTTANSVSTLKHLASSKNTLSSDQKKQVRMLKFADPKLKNRAERFGVEISEPVTATENEKIKERVLRFNEVVSPKAKTLDEKDRLEKRRARFGVVEAANRSSNGFKSAASPVVVEKIQKRQERFGVVDAGSKLDSSKILPGFKRRRFAN